MTLHTWCCSTTNALCGAPAEAHQLAPDTGLLALPWCPNCQALDTARVPCSLDCPIVPDTFTDPEG